MTQKDNATEKLKSMGFDAINDSGTIIVKAPSEDYENTRAALNKAIASIGYNASWGIIGKTVIKPIAKETEEKLCSLETIETETGQMCFA